MKARLAAAVIPVLAYLLSGSVSADAAQCGGAAWAPPGGGWGPVSTSPQAAAGFPGYKLAYRWHVEGNVPTMVCAQGLGFDQSNHAQWYGLGCSYDGGLQAVPWGNNLGPPELRAKSLNVVNGVIVSWLC